MADAVDLYVDLGELTQVRAEVQALLSSLTDLSTHAGTPVTASSTGSADVTDAVVRFRRRWHDATERMVENLRSCLDYADLALDQYGKTEQTLCDGLGVTPTAGARSAAP